MYSYCVCTRNFWTLVILSCDTLAYVKPLGIQAWFIRMSLPWVILCNTKHSTEVEFNTLFPLLEMQHLRENKIMLWSTWWSRDIRRTQSSSLSGTLHNAPTMTSVQIRVISELLTMDLVGSNLDDQTYFREWALYSFGLKFSFKVIDVDFNII